MKSALLIAATFTAFTCAFAGGTPSPNPEDINVFAVIVKAKAEALSRAFVELKLQEAVIGSTNPVDQQKLSVIRSQQAVINEEFSKLENLPLKRRLQELETGLQEKLKTVKETNPQALDIKEAIVKCRAEIDRIEGGKPSAAK